MSDLDNDRDNCEHNHDSSHDSHARREFLKQTTVASMILGAGIPTAKPAAAAPMAPAAIDPDRKNLRLASLETAMPLPELDYASTRFLSKDGAERLTFAFAIYADNRMEAYVPMGRAQDAKEETFPRNADVPPIITIASITDISTIEVLYSKGATWAWWTSAGARKHWWISS